MTLKVWDPDGKGPLPGELSDTNNEMDTFVTVMREGLSVLLVERLGRFAEPQRLLAALAADKRMRVDVVWLAGTETLTPDQKGLFQFDQQPYDVIILGDVTAARLKEADPEAMTKLRDRVRDKRTGLLMLGCERGFANGGWAAEEVGKILPVKLNRKGRIGDAVRLIPTREGLNDVLRLGKRAGKPGPLGEDADTGGRPAQRRLRDGRPATEREAVRAVAGGSAAAGRCDAGTGRTMAFGCDMTHLWERPDNGVRRYMLVSGSGWCCGWRTRKTPRTTCASAWTPGRWLWATNSASAWNCWKQREEIKDARYTVKIVDARRWRCRYKTVAA